MTISIRNLFISFMFWGVILSGSAVSEGVSTENKNITLINAEASADGKTRIAKELLEECYLSMPLPAHLEAEVTSESVYLKGINGKNSKDSHTKTYSAVVNVNYILYQKELIIVSVSSVQGQKPEIKEVERKIKQVKVFVSDPSEGDIYAGRSDRKYYFSSAEGAKKDALKRAETWIKQQSSVSCPN